MRTLLLLPFRFLRWALRGRRRAGLFVRLGQVVLVAALLFVCTGYVRGPDFDRFVLDQLVRLRAGTRSFFAGFIVSAGVVDGVLLVLQYGVFAAGALLLALAVSRVPCFTGFLVLTEYHRRRGHAFSKGEMLMGLTLPVCLGLMLCCYGEASLLAWFHACLAFGYVRFSCDPARVDRMLDWSARVQGGLDDPYAAGGVDEEGT